MMGRHYCYAVSNLVILSLVAVVQAQTYPNPGGCVSVANPPENFNNPSQCNLTGRHQTSYGSETGVQSAQGTDNLNNCRNLCMRRLADSLGNTGCVSFGYNTTSKLCTIYDLTTYYTVTKDPTSAVTFYDATCFTCPSVCPATVGESVLDNGGFENYKNNIGPWVYPYDSKEVQITSPGHNSSQAMHVPFISDGDYWIVEQAFDSCPYTAYAVTFDYRILGTSGGKPTMSVLVGDLQYALSAFPYNDDTFKLGVWGTFTDVFYPLATAFDPPGNLELLNILAYSGATGGLNSYIDNAAITPFTKSLTARSGASEMVKNPGFGSGALSPWDVMVFKSSGSGKVVCSNGKRSCLFRVTVKPNVLVEPAVQIQQNVTGLAVGSQYLLSFDYQTTQGNQFTVGFGPSTYSYVACLSDQPCNGTMKRAVVARNETSLLSFLVEGQNQNYTLSMAFDNISIKTLV